MTLRIASKLAVIVLLVGILMVFAATEVEFVYAGF